MEETLHKPTLRVMNILSLIDRSEKPLSLTEIATALDLPKSTISPIIRTLLETDYLEQTKDGRYEISFRLFQLGLSYSGRLGVLSAIKKEQEDIVKKVGEICQFGVLVDDQVLYLEKVQAQGSIEVVSSVGKKLPAYCTALGKALLSGMEDEAIRELFKGKPFKKMTDNTISDVESLIQDVRLVRERGYALDDQEIAENLQCIAVPIVIKHKVKGALSVTYPIFRDEEGKREKVIRILLEKKELLEEIIRIQDFDLNWEH